MNKHELKKANRLLKKANSVLKPPEDLTLSEWADKYRVLSFASAEGGNKWRTSRTPYMKEPMDAFTDPNVREIFVISPSQCGKSELELNAIGYIIDQDPGPIMYIQPGEDDAERFSDFRISPMLHDCPTIRNKMGAASRGTKNRKSKSKKTFPGGILMINGSRSPSKLSSSPIRYLLGDEVDRWTRRSGEDGDPWELAKTRTTTFYNDKHLAVSTPLLKSNSKICELFYTGTQEYWKHKCPHCGEWHYIKFSDIVFDKNYKIINKHKTWQVSDIYYRCPKCGALSTEQEMRNTKQEWKADNPIAYEHGIRSFWLSPFASPWVPWKSICLNFLYCGHDPEKLKTFYNTKLGQPWEDRGEVGSEDEFLRRRENYGYRDDGSRIEVPEGVILLTAGIDTQGNRLEYEVLGHGLYGETWGVEKGTLMGDPNLPEVWQKLDDLKAHAFLDKDKRPFYIRLMFIDSGGNKTSAVYDNVLPRQGIGVAAIKGQGGEGIPLVPQYPHRLDNGIELVNLGVDEGKAYIMGSLRVKSPGPRYCHFPSDPEAGYDENYFASLLSEKPETTQTGKTRWVKIEGHERNEALDIRNYAIAAFRFLHADLQAEMDRLNGVQHVPKKQPVIRKKSQYVSSSSFEDDVWSNDW